jgi:hypothetical protein
MKYYLLYFIASFLLLIGCQQKTTSTVLSQSMDKTAVEKKQLRHIVLFKFKEDATAAQIKNVEDSFANLENLIPEISGFEWGLNNSPESLHKGFTHCFLVSFDSEAARERYLPNPDHQAFVKLLGPVIDDVLVFDFWNK